MPISAIDIDGLEEFLVVNYFFYNAAHEKVIYKRDYHYVKKEKRRVINRENTAFVVGEVEAKGGKLVKGAENAKLLRSGIVFTKKSIEDRGVTPETTLEEIDPKEANYWRSTAKKRGQDAYEGVSLKQRTLAFLWGADEGNTAEDIRKFLKTSANHEKNLKTVASYLINVPGASATITGFASPTPTDIDGDEGTITEENNVKLSKQRAEAMKEVLLDYIKTDLKVEDFDASRITTIGTGTSKARADGVTEDSSEEELKLYQKTNVTVTNTEMKRQRKKSGK